MIDPPWEVQRLVGRTPLQLEFAWIGDRWSHAIRHETASAPVIRADSADPPSDRPECLISPAYQELTREAEGTLLLLLGRAGAHHHSAVVSATPGGFRFDLANRCSLPTPIASATYLLELTSSDLLDAQDDRIAWRLGEGQLILAAEPPARLSLAEAGRRCTRVQVTVNGEPGQRTQRLAYRWEWAPEPSRVAERAEREP